MWEEILEGSAGVHQEWGVRVVVKESQGETVASGGDQEVAEGLPASLGQVQGSSVEAGARMDLQASVLEVLEAALVEAEECPVLVDSV